MISKQMQRSCTISWKSGCTNGVGAFKSYGWEFPAQKKKNLNVLWEGSAQSDRRLMLKKTAAVRVK